MNLSFWKFAKAKNQDIPVSSSIKIPQKKESLASLWKLTQIMLTNLEFEDVASKVVNSILEELGYLNLGYRIVVLALINTQTGFLERIAISETPEAKKALQLTPVPFKDIKIPLSENSNIAIRALREQLVYKTRSWYDILRPVYTPDQATTIQEAIGIKSSMVYPLTFLGKPIGILIFSMFKDYQEVNEEEADLLNGFVDLVGLTVRNSMLYGSLKSTTKQLEYANQRLQELDKVKDDFVSIASHELRTPMTAIRSYVWMALNRPDMALTEKMKKYLSRTLISTERLISLVNDMLNISRIESGRISITPLEFDMKSLVADVIAEVETKAREKNLNITMQDGQIPKIFADSDKVHQVLLNLVGNAMKFTPNSGTITISFFSDGVTLETSIKDSGVGITPEDMARLFKKFGKLDNSYVAAATSGGTGLGLYISKSLIDLMHGRIWARSDGVNKGTTFTFSLPVATEAVVKDALKYEVKPAGEVKSLEPVAI